MYLTNRQVTLSDFIIRGDEISLQASMDVDIALSARKRTVKIKLRDIETILLKKDLSTAFATTSSNLIITYIFLNLRKNFNDASWQFYVL